MRWIAQLAIGLTLAGCPPKQPVTTAEPETPVGHPDLKCPPGTQPAGHAPPHGFEVWCEKPNTTNTAFVREGPVIAWHTNQQRKTEGAYVAGREHGAWLYWYPTGTPQQQGSYAMGVRDGVWTSYHADGERASEGQYVDGKEHGTWTYWDTENLTRTEGEYVLGDRDGVWTDFGPDDEVVRERHYRRGRLISVTGER